MRSKPIKFVLSMLVLLYIFLPDAKAADKGILIIVNKESPIEYLTLNMLVDIYTNNRSKWDNGEKIRVCMLKNGPVHDAFTRQMIGMTTRKLLGIWKKVAITGLGIPPRIVKTEAEMIQYVADTKGAIGYVSASASPENVSVYKLNTILNKIN